MFDDMSAYKSLLKEMTHNESLDIILGLFTLLLGLAVVVNHNVWKGWPITITIVGYWIAMKGIVLIYFPENINKLIMILQMKNLYLAFVPSLAIGVVLLYFGFLHHRKTLQKSKQQKKDY